MTKDVLVTISGMQNDIEDTPIELVTVGTYYLKNGKHYVLFEEQVEDGDAVTKNTVKFYDGHFEIVKRGGANSFLVFENGKKTSSIYNTLVGPLQIDTVTSALEMEESQDLIRVYVKYSLNMNQTFISECEVHFTVQARM